MEVHLVEHLVGADPRTTTVSSTGGLGQRGERVLEQRPPVELGQLLAPAETGAGAGGEDECGDHHSENPLSMAWAKRSSEASVLPAMNRSTWGSAAFMPRASGS